MQLYFLIALGGALGSVLRYAFNGFIVSYFGEMIPWIGIVIVNVTGSFLIGFISTLTGPDGRWFASANTRLFFMTGICGGYTTFSSFSLNTLNLARDGQWFYAGLNVVSSVVLCLVAVWLGHVAAAYLNANR